MFSSSLAFGGYTGSQADVPMEPVASQAGQDKQGENILLPVTIRMIERAVAARGNSDGDLRVDGRDVNTILIVGCVEDLNKQQTSMEFSINDSTGKMRARYYFASPDIQKSLEKVENNTYVTIVGVIKMAPTVHVSVLTMRPVQSPDEISYHMVEVAHSSLRSKKKLGTNSAGSTLSKVVSSPPRSETPVNSVVTPLRRNDAPQLQAAPVMATPPKSEGPLKDRIAKFLSEKTEAAPEGLTEKMIAESFCDSKAEDIKKSVQELLADGDVYTTIDDDHFAHI
jgi:replication factor A2